MPRDRQQDAVHELQLQIDRGPEPITGRISGAGGEPIAFTGWLQLAAALEYFLHDGAVPDPRDDRSG